MYDGIVVSYLDEDIREKLGRKNFVNKYSMAVKFNPLKKQTMFLGYTFTIGQDGSVTPMIHYNPVEFYGTIHDKSTGHSYERFKTLNLRPGDILDVEYVNDVMPYVSKAECLQNDINQNEPVSFIDTCISCGGELVISESGKTVFCKNINCPSRVTSRLNNMLDKLNLKDFAEQSIISIGKTHLCDMIDLKQEDLENILGIVNAQKFVDRMTQLKTEPIFDFQIVGALGFTNIASQKWKLIFSNITLKELYSSWLENPMNMHILTDIKGIGTSVVSTILEEMIYFQRDIEYILSMPNMVNSRGQSFGKSIRCTGFRCPELMEELRALGHDANDNGSVTKTTDILLVPIKGHVSSKIAKAGPDTQIVPIDEFISNRSKYLQ
jgi:NAD-dependent DNA ligase